jgi:tetratricopeptide (TPR) repeat protein
VLLFLLAFIYYLSGLCGTIPSYRDSGDLIASIHTLGIAHPPGYALYVMVGKLFETLLPFGNVAYRVNVMSAFFAAGAVTLLFRLIRHTGETCLPAGRAGTQNFSAWSPACAGVTAILFATSPAVVALARVAEMYTMALCIGAGILLCLEIQSRSAYCGAALLLGLGLSVHPTLLFLIPVFVSAYPLSEVTPSRRQAVAPILFFLLGLSVFLYLPIRASQHPLINWGDPSNWRNFWRVVTRADYGGLKLHPEESSFTWSPADIINQLHYFCSSLKGEYGWGALSLGIIGVVAGLKQQDMRRRTAGFLGAWLLAGPAFFLLSNLPLHEPTTPAILQPYLLLVNLIWAFFIGMGMDRLMLSLPGALFSRSNLAVKQRDCFASLAMTALALGALLLRPWNLQWQRNDFYAYDYARNLLRSLPKQAVLFEPDDPTRFSIQVLQMAEHRRSDVVLLNFFRTRWGYEEIKRRWPDLLPPIPIGSGQELERILWSYSSRKQPFYAELPQKLAPMPYRSEGLAYAAQAESGSASRARAEALLNIIVRRGDFVTTHHPDFFTSHLVSYYAAAENNLGIEYANAGQWRAAVAHYQAALEIEPDQAAARQNLAVALQKIPKLL